MSRKQKQYHYLYKTTNVVNEKYYVGIHSTDNLDDGYMGSGKYLWNSVRKYGRENFKMEILEFFESRKDLVQREKNIVNEDFIKHPMCMNLKSGGEGGFISVEQQRNRSIAGGKAFSKKLKIDKEFKVKFSKRVSLIMKMNHKQGKFKYGSFSGKNHKEDTKIKMRDKAKLRIGDKNSQFGTCWIFNNEKKESKKIKLIDLQNYQIEGWLKGRKIKFD